MRVYAWLAQIINTESLSARLEDFSADTKPWRRGTQVLRIGLDARYRRVGGIGEPFSQYVLP